MSTQSVNHHAAHAGGHEHHEHHPDPTETKVFGFWIYIMSDCVLFGTLFAVYAVLGGNYAGGPTASELFELPIVLFNTFILLASSFAIGLATLAFNAGQKKRAIQWLVATLILGAAFVGVEIYEFVHFVSLGATAQTSAFLSSFFTLVGTHGLHVTAGVVWAVILVFQIASKGLTEGNKSRLMCLGLFWHFLHIIWICVFSIVYLMGVL